MSDSSQGPGWWQASDGKWYPPEQAPGAGPPPDVGGDASFGDTFGYAWNKFVQNIGQWIVLWLIFFAIAILFVVLSFAIAATGDAATSGFALRFNALGLVLGTIGGVVSGVLLVVIAKAALMAVNGQSVDIGAAFQLTGNNIAAGAVFGLIAGLLSSFCGFFGILVYLFLGFMPILSAVDDKGVESLSEAWSLSTSKAGQVMPFFAVGWLISGCLCGIGSPIFMLGGTYLLKRFRGEPIAP